MKCKTLFCCEWYDGPVQAIGLFDGVPCPLALSWIAETDLKLEYFGRIYAGHSMTLEDLSSLLADATIRRIFPTLFGTTVLVDMNEKLEDELSKGRDQLCYALRLEDQIDDCVPVADVLGTQLIEVDVSARQATQIQEAFAKYLISEREQ